MSVTTAPSRGSAAPPTTRRGGRVSALVAVAAAVAALLVAPPWRSPEGVPAGFAGRLAAGDLQRQGGERWMPVAVGDLVPAGVRVRSAEGAQLEVREGRLTLADSTRAVLDEATVLEVGSLLVEAPARRRSVQVGQLQAAGRGVWRVDATGGRRVGVYEGGVGIQPADQPGGGLAVEWLQEAPIVGGQLPGRALPLRYAAFDPWDARLLGDLFAVDRQAEQFHRSFVARYGVAPQPRGFYTRFQFVDDALAAGLDRLGMAVGPRGLGPPADVLLAALVTDLLRDRAGLTTSDALSQVAALRADGATWGIILARRNLDASDLRDAIALALRAAPATAPNQGPLQLRPTVAPEGTTTARGRGGARGVSAPPRSGGDRREPDANATPSPRPSPAPTDPPAPGPCQLESCQPINETGDGLTDLVDDAAPGAGGTLDDLVEEIPTILPPSPPPLPPVSLPGG